MKKTSLLLIFILAAIISNAVNVKFQKHQITQPDGTVINCFVSGDEFFNWIHDENGYSIIKGSDGYYCYAIKENEKIIASDYRVNTINPADVGISKWIKISEKEYSKKRDSFLAPMKAGPSNAPHTGALNNIVIYIRFQGEDDFSTTRNEYDNNLNPTTGESLKSYFKEVSYDQLTINSTHYPDCALPATTNASYEDSHTRDYFQPYDASTNPNGYQGNESITREHQLLVDAVNWVNANYPIDGGLNIDGDGDGDVDNVCFMIRGNSGDWAELLWAHRWVLYSQPVYINGKRVYDYTFQPENQVEVRTLCHEMFHALGAPDLYHYYEGTYLDPVGTWDLMESGFVHMGAYMKYKYANGKWISNIPEITTEGTYTLNPLTSSTNNCYKIASPNSSDEYFVLEYRKQSGDFESNIHGDGLLVYRINTNFEGNAGYNGSSVFDEVYIYRPGGTISSNGTISNAYFSSEAGRIAINDLSNPASFLSDDSDGGLQISNITSASSTISFDIAYKPSIEITSTEEVSTTLYPIPVKIEFSEDVTGFELNDIYIGNGNLENFNQVSNSIYTLDVTPLKAGKVYVRIDEGVAVDTDDNANYGIQWTITFDWPAGINKLSDAGISIYPNPSNGIFNLEINDEYKECNIQLIDLAGRVLYEEVLNNINQHQLNLNEFKQGLYIIKLNIDNNQFNERLIIK